MVVGQVMKDWSCRDPIMKVYYQVVPKLEAKFDRFELTHVLCQDNEATNKLAKMGSNRDVVSASIFL